MSKWRESVSFGRQHAGEDGYAAMLLVEVMQITVNVGVPFGFGMWLFWTFVAEVFPEFSGAPAVFFVIMGAFFGLAMAVTFAPGSLRVVMRGETADPDALISRVREALEKKGYEPVELSDRLCKLDKAVGLSGFSFGPLSLSPSNMAVTLVPHDRVVTLAGSAEILSTIVNLAGEPGFGR
jgi:hypothetical protein